jgi:lysyl-tRNA synthetase class 2
LDTKKLLLTKKWFEFHRKIRNFFEENGYLEVHTPKLGKYATIDTNIDSFVTSDCLGEKYYLQTSPEYYHKELLSYGFNQIFELNSAFRNEPKEKIHNPEFLILEWYRVGYDYNFMMNETEKFIKKMAENTDLKLPDRFEKKSVSELFLEYANIELEDSLSKEKIKIKANDIGIKINDDDDWDSIFFKIFLTKIEPRFKNKAIFVYDYPEKLGAMARTKKSNPDFAERFELYINGIELCNGYSELTDYNIQKIRFERDIKERKRLGLPIFPINMRFLSALKRGIPACTGNALGVERLFSLIYGIDSIHDFIIEA